MSQLFIRPKMTTRHCAGCVAAAVSPRQNSNEDDLARTAPSSCGRGPRVGRLYARHRVWQPPPGQDLNQKVTSAGLRYPVSVAVVTATVSVTVANRRMGRNCTAPGKRRAGGGRLARTWALVTRSMTQATLIVRTPPKGSTPAEMFSHRATRYPLTLGTDTENALMGGDMLARRLMSSVRRCEIHRDHWH